jgi:hypothetical protein
MIYTFLLVSDEVDDFVRIINIDADASFTDLHQAILASVDYKDDQITSFFTCNENWEKEKEITMMDMSIGNEDVSLMKDTVLKTMIEQENQRMLYVFDPLAERVFFLELSKITPSKNLKAPLCSHSEGEAPQQIKGINELLLASSQDFQETDELYEGLSYHDDDLMMDDIDLDDMSSYY